MSVFRWSSAERVDQPSLAQPLGHLLQLASLGRRVNLEGQRGGRAHCGLTSVRRGGRRGSGRLWRRGKLPDELRGGRVALVLGVLQGGVAGAVEQLGVGLGSQQRLHARLLPFGSSIYQGGMAISCCRGCLASRRSRLAAVAPSPSPGGRRLRRRAAGLRLWSDRRQLDQSRARRPALPCAASWPPSAARRARLTGRSRRVARRESSLLRRRCVLPDELRGGRVALGLGVLQGGTAIGVEQLGIGLGAQQGLHARLVPVMSGHHQGTTAVSLQEHDGEVAVVRSIHERGDAEAARQVDARASLQQHPHHLQPATGYSGMQQAEGFELALASPRRVVDREGQQGGRALPGLSSVRWGGRLGGGRLGRRCVLPGELRSGRLALDLGPLRCGAAVHVDQLGAGPGE
eukprot:scaffold5570_cov69-Phaeocystis_antarctica.AAC.2